MAVLFVCLASTAALVERERQRVAALNASRFEAAVDDVRDALEQRLQDFELVLGGVRGFVNGSASIDRREWRAYADSLRLDEGDGAIAGLVYVQRVAPADVEAFVEEVRAEYLPTFEVRSLPNPTSDPRPVGPCDADARHIVRYYEPIERNRQKLGADLMTSRTSVPTQLLARDTGRIALTIPSFLIRPDGTLSETPNGLIMYAAVYAPGRPTSSVEERRAAYSGFVALPVHTDRLVTPAVGARLSEQVHVRLRDADGDRPIWANEPTRGAARAGQTARHTIEHGGRRWVLTAEARPNFAVYQIAAARVGWSGGVGSLLLTALVWTLVSIRKRAESMAETMARRAAAMEARFSAAFHGCGSGMGLLDVRGRWLSANSAMSRLLGADRCSPDGATLVAAADPADQAAVIDALAELLDGKAQHVAFDCRFRRPGDDGLWGLVSLSRVGLDADPRDGEPVYLVVQIQDISAKKHAERELERAARQDHLTGLASRASFHEALADAFAAAAPGRAGFAVVFLDLDRFKQVNDTLGHDAGDRLLVGVAGRINAVLRGSGGRRDDADCDVPARLGGDEFAVLLRGLPDAPAAVGIADRLRRAIGRPFDLDGCTAGVGASVGVATSFGDYATPEEMLRRSDLAMYDAKRRGRGGPGAVVNADAAAGQDGRGCVPLRLAA